MLPKEPTMPEPSVSSRLAPVFGALLFVLVFAAVASYAARSLSLPREVYDCEESEAPPGDRDPGDYRRWDKPDLALILTGQMFGYIDPCGCSEPQHGGLIRRYNFVESLKAKNWDVVGIDLGDLPQPKGIHAQNVLKFDLSVKSLGKMDYRAFGIGRGEILMDLGVAMTTIWDKNQPFPRPINTTLAQTKKGEFYYDLNVRPYEIINTKPKIGVINLMGTDLRDELKAREKFLANVKELPNALRAFADASVEIGIILHHEHPNLDKNTFPENSIKRLEQVEKVRRELALKCAEFCAAERKKNKKIPPIQLMMILTDSPEASFIMRRVDDKLPTHTVEVGHKGKYVGLVGVYRAGKSYRLQYRPVLMGPEWKTTDEKKKGHPVIALFDQYLQDLKSQDMLAKYPRTQHINQLPPANQNGLKSTFVGSERCGDCHDHAYAVWKKKHEGEIKYHALATETLEKLTFPAGRQFDPECMKCHTTGFQHPGGYNDLVTDLAKWPAKPTEAPTAKKIKQHNDSLRGVGCESCHGPGSEHVKNPNNKAIYALINPYRASNEERQLIAAYEKDPKDARTKNALKIHFATKKRGLNIFCMKCHDSENDVNWGGVNNELFDKWIGKKMYHHAVKNNNGGAIPLPAKNANVPALVEPPRFSIEVIEEKKK